jgi:UPF0716 family protein affecting phage T7 exclusion
MRYALLWVSIGGSPGYEIFAGCAEVAAGVLLLFPRTTMLGALLAVADMTEVWTLNMTYDVPVKLFSFHLLLLALVILAPESQRLIDFALRNRTVEPSNQLQLFQKSAANRIALGAQILFGVGLLVGFAHMCLNARHIWGDDHPKIAVVRDLERGQAFPPSLVRLAAHYRSQPMEARYLRVPGLDAFPGKRRYIVRTIFCVDRDVRSDDPLDKERS